MKFVKPTYEIIDQQPGIDGLFKQIELAGRTCYKSEDKITEDSAEGFVKRMIDSGHTAMLEHGTVYLTIPKTDAFDEYGENIIQTIYGNSPYSKVVDIYDGNLYVTTNYRVIVENHLEDHMKYVCEPTEHHKKRRTVKMTTSIHVYKDLTRHRKMSFAIESTRYCNYSKGKFNSELTFIEPEGLVFGSANELQFNQTLQTIEKAYIDLVNYGQSAEGAAEILPQCTKADVVITGFEGDWNHIFRLRALGVTGRPHPEVLRIMVPLWREFRDRKYSKLNLKEYDQTKEEAKTSEG